MKNILTGLVLLSASLLLNICRSPEIDGGWVAMDTKSREVRDAVEFLNNELKTRHPDVRITKVLSAQSQIVAGQNMKITAIYTSDINKKGKTLEALIFITLDDKYTLTSLDLD
jgi:hypothetical protein